MKLPLSLFVLGGRQHHRKGENSSTQNTTYIYESINHLGHEVDILLNARIGDKYCIYFLLI